MIPKDKALKLIKIYMYVCKQYDENPQYYCQRYSNNSVPVFTDQEILTIYLFVGSEQRYTRLKEIHKFVKEYLLDWFPTLVSHQTFVYRLNKMAGAVTKLLKQLISAYKPTDCDDDTLIVDSLPIMTCTGRNRVGKVAPDIAGKTIFADKIYRDGAFWDVERESKSYELLTPIKAIKGVTEQEWQRNKAADDLYSAAASSVREPVEAFFSWLNDKTNIQRANKCWSTAGLLLHTIGKLAIAFIFLIFNY